MITLSKPMIAMAAVAAAGLVAMLDMAQSSPQENPAATVAARFPQTSEMLLARNVGKPVQPAAAVTAPGKTDKLAPAAGCTREHWPYIADECLVSADDAKTRRPVRTITIERTPDGSSPAARTPVRVAAR